MIDYPIKVKASADFIETFSDSEEPAYWDAVAEFKADPTLPDVIDVINPEHHTYEVLKRNKTVIEIRNDAELLDVYYRLGSGLISCTDSDRCRIRQAKRIQSELKPYVLEIDKSTSDVWDIR